MALWMAVDFGTSSTCAVMAADAAAPRLVVVDGAPLLPSAVYAAPDGRLFVGQDAQRQAAIDPSRYEPHPKRHLDEGELLLGDRVVPVVEVVRAVLARMVAEARRATGGAPVEHLVLTHPADWGPVRPAVLRSAAQPLAREVVLVPEPVAATLFYLTELRPDAGRGGDLQSGPSPAAPAAPAVPGAALAVLDLGGGTVDASVLRCGSVTRLPGPAPGSRIWDVADIDVTVLATRGDPHFGGADIDQALLDHVGTLCSPADPAAWRALVEGRELADQRRRRVLRDDVRTAKETLSRHSYADVPVPPPFRDVHVTRADLERLIEPALGGPVALLDEVLTEAGYGPGQRRPVAVFLVGGSSRIPLVARLVHERLGILPFTLDVPETVVAHGALRLVRGDSMPCAPVNGDASPIPPRRSRASLAALVALVVVAPIVVGAAVVALVWGAGRDGAGQDAGGRVARYGYSFALVPGWEQVAGNDSLREVRLVPAGSNGPTGPEAVLVQKNQLDYDSDAAPARPRRELQNQLADSRRSGTARYSSFDPDASFAGRDVIYYRERPADGSTVDWYVLLQRRVQVSVGCRHTPAAARQVERACREVVRTLQIS
ncbi:MAG: type VII secretion-associated protein [Pseudonocardiaceae bacterium]